MAGYDDYDEHQETIDDLTGENRDLAIRIEELESEIEDQDALKARIEELEGELEEAKDHLKEARSALDDIQDRAREGLRDSD